ncbi:MAG: glycosyltransferase family 2 protein [Candidatus Riflebacteria bacterium]|nr:glycosyltransferase family 2 protein [Candidatus Riflebacteria bacterium]
MTTKIGVLVPCYRVGKTASKVLESFSSRTLERIHEVVAVDNCSPDDTFEVLRRAQAAGTDLARKLTIIRNAENYGLGGTQKIAYRYFLDSGFTHFFIVHGDNQGNGDAIAGSFLDAFDREPAADVIFASRFLAPGGVAEYSRLRTVGNRFFNLLTRVLTGVKMSDSGAGIVFYRAAVLDRVPFENLTNSFQFNPQLNILLGHLDDLKRLEVPLVWGDSEAGSNVRALEYCLTLSKILLGYRFRRSLLGRTGWRAFSSGPCEPRPSFELFRLPGP